MDKMHKARIKDLFKKLQNFITISKNSKDPRIIKYLKGFKIP